MIDGCPVRAGVPRPGRRAPSGAPTDERQRMAPTMSRRCFPRIPAGMALIPAILITTTSTADAADAPPAVPREFRAVWVATVGNIDWPSKPGLSTADQKREAVKILDQAAALRLNAVVFQIRPSADA